MQPLITVFCAFTRRWAIEQWLADLSRTNIDPARTNLAVVIDIDDPFILRQLQVFAEKNGYRKFIYKMNDFNPNEVKIAARRLRIADVKNQSKALIAQCDGDIILSLEDDTHFPNLDIYRLIDPLQRDQVGFVQGVQCGRWGVKMIGAWRSDNPLDPYHIETLMPPAETGSESPYESIDGGGWYGYATKKHLYLQCEYYASSGQPWGPDVNYGLWLKRMGFECYIDWHTVFGHNNYNRIIWPHDTPGTPLKERLAKLICHKDPATGRWDRHDEHPAR